MVRSQRSSAQRLALAPSPTKVNGDKSIMSYRDSLNCWLVVRLLPKMQRQVVARCRTRSDADGYLQVVRRFLPDAKFTVVFDPNLELDSQA